MPSVFASLQNNSEKKHSGHTPLTRTFNTSIFSMQLIDCNAVLRKKGKTGEYSEFVLSKCFGGRYSGVESIPYGVRVYVNPSINVALFG